MCVTNLSSIEWIMNLRWSNKEDITSFKIHKQLYYLSQATISYFTCEQSKNAEAEKWEELISLFNGDSPCLKQILYHKVSLSRTRFNLTKTPSQENNYALIPWNPRWVLSKLEKILQRKMPQPSKSKKNVLQGKITQPSKKKYITWATFLSVQLA